MTMPVVGVPLLTVVGQVCTVGSSEKLSGPLSCNNTSERRISGISSTQKGRFRRPCTPWTGSSPSVRISLRCYRTERLDHPTFQPPFEFLVSGSWWLECASFESFPQAFDKPHYSVWFSVSQTQVDT